MAERPCRIVEEHHPETREQDVERALGQLGAAGVGNPEQGRRILWRKRARSANQRFGYVHAQHLAYHSVKLDDPSFTAPIYANLFEGDDAPGEGNLCSQTSIDCWAKIPAIAPCDDARVTEGKKGVVRSPAA